MGFLGDYGNKIRFFFTFEVVRLDKSNWRLLSSSLYSFFFWGGGVGGGELLVENLFRELQIN